MKLQRKAIIIAIALTIGTAGCIVTSFVSYAVKPTLSHYYGLKLHNGLNGEVTILRDKYGIPHIQGDNLNDIFFAVGYAQAQDRLFQMDLFRRQVGGRLAEVIGDRKTGLEPGQGPTSILEVDKFHRVIGFRYISDAGTALLKEYRPETYKQLEGYAAGVNAYIEDCGDDLPLEFKMLDYTPEPWTMEDSVLIARYVGWWLASNLEEEVGRWILTNKFGEELARQLLPIYKKSAPGIPTIIPREVRDFRKLTPIHPKITRSMSPLIPAPSEAILALSRTITANRALNTYFPSKHASNNWVVSPKLTASGKPILANDPHLGHGMPSTFWQVHLKGAGLDIFGVAFPGLPLVVLGHNRHLAWGLTTSIADVQDLYIEKLDETGEKYLYKGDWLPITKRTEVLRARKGLSGPVEDAGSIEVRLTRHGPIINDIDPKLADAPPMALRWVGYDYTDDQELTRALLTSSDVDEFMEKARKLNPVNLKHEADSILMCMKAESIDDFREALSFYGIPNQNWVAVDDKGNIGYIAAGRVPVRAKGMSLVPVPGWTGEYEWVGFIPPDHLPQVFNPERGYITTANNEVVPPDDYPYVFSYSYAPGWRAMRIEQLLKEKSAKKKLTAQDMAEIQNDVKMLAAEHMLPIMLKSLEGMTDLTLREYVAIKLLENWDYFATTDSVACSIFNAWIVALPKLMVEDELGEEYFKIYMSSGGLYIVSHLAFDDSPLFDNKNTPEKETRDDIFRQAFRMSIERLKKELGGNMEKWQWGRLHTIEFKHPLGIGPLARYLNYGPMPHHGGLATVRNAGHGPNDFRTRGGPVLRHVIDMADVESSLWVTDGGESGQWKSPHYKDGAEVWLKGEYKRAIMNIDEVAAENEGLLKLRPLPDQNK